MSDYIGEAHIPSYTALSRFIRVLYGLLSMNPAFTHSLSDKVSFGIQYQKPEKESDDA